ncbi:unnamed protein product [Soboliphyme baturini]|uniref:CaMKII_AD domain-containing protein n=1 Tax=Soboliphyme baturini TaxID=241478 RepID=A0A183IC63_9BILA|nr:unnamed protein product [Soboliphyme baturini]
MGSVRILVRKKEILKLTEQIIEAISNLDYNTYSKLCDMNMTCFEPASMGHLVEGMDYHKFYFNQMAAQLRLESRPSRTILINPVVYLMGEDAACVAYIRLTQLIDKQGIPQPRQVEETRVWQKRDGKWLCIHTHLSSSAVRRDP